MHCAGNVHLHQSFNGLTIQNNVTYQSNNVASKVELPEQLQPYLLTEALAPLVFRTWNIDRSWRGGSLSLLGWAETRRDIYFPVCLRLIGEEKINVPVGTFDTWKIAVSSMHRTQYVWIRKSDHQVVRSQDSMRHAGETMEVALVKEETI